MPVKLPGAWIDSRSFVINTGTANPLVIGPNDGCRIQRNPSPHLNTRATEWPPTSEPFAVHNDVFWGFPRSIPQRWEVEGGEVDHPAVKGSVKAPPVTQLASKMTAGACQFWSTHQGMRIPSNLLIGGLQKTLPTQGCRWTSLVCKMC